MKNTGFLYLSFALGTAAKLSKRIYFRKVISKIISPEIWKRLNEC
jgi:hypothetical protein